MYKRKYALFILVIYFLFSLSFQNKPIEKHIPEIPKPEEIKNILFYIQRSINISAIIYELNYNEDHELNTKEPIKIYWKNYASDGSVQSLNFIQKKYAYGIDVKLIDSEKKLFCFNFVSYKKKTIYLIRSSSDNTYKAFIEIDGKLVVLKKIFIQIDGGTFWFPRIKYIEITGRDFSKEKDVSERIIPT